MGKMVKLFGIIAAAAVIGFSLASCGGTGSPARGDGNVAAVVGTWSGTIFGEAATLTITATGWILEVSGIGFFDTGSFTMRGNDAVIFDAERVEIGRATLVNNNTIRLTLNQWSIAPGTYTLIRAGISPVTITVTGFPASYAGRRVSFHADCLTSGVWASGLDFATTTLFFELFILEYIGDSAWGVTDILLTNGGNFSLQLQVALNGNSAIYLGGVHALTRGNNIIPFTAFTFWNIWP